MMNSSAQSSASSHEPSFIRSIEGVEEYTLNNGLQVLLIPDQDKATMLVNMVYKVGARHEQAGQSGIAHFLEHYCFKGTAKYPEPLQSFQSRGIQANASTSFDRTNFYAVFAAEEENLDWYLGWQADLMQNLKIKQQDLKTELKVILDEKANNHNHPLVVLAEKMHNMVFAQHPYGRPMIGSNFDLNRITSSQVNDFYQRYYRPYHAVLVVSGQFDPQTALALIMKHFAAIPGATRNETSHTLPPYTNERIQRGERHVILRGPEEQSYMMFMYLQPPAATREAVWLRLAVDMITEAPSGPLYKEFVLKGHVNASIGQVQCYHDYSLASFTLVLNQDAKRRRVYNKLQHLLEHSAAYYFTQKQLDRVRKQWLNQWRQLFNDTINLGLGLTEAIATGDWRLFFWERQEVEGANLADIKAIVGKYWLASNRNSGQFIGQSIAPVKFVPFIAPPNIEELLQDFEGQTQAPQNSAFDSSITNIQRQTIVKQHELPQGKIKFAILPKENRGQYVYLSYCLLAGQAEDYRNQALVREFAVELLYAGTTSLKRQKLYDRLDKLEALLNFHAENNSLVVSLHCPVERLAKALKLSFKIIRDANFDEEELQLAKQKNLAMLQAQKSNPAYLMQNTLERHFYQYEKLDCRYSPTIQEKIDRLEALTRQELLDFKDKFYGVNRVLVSAVGPLDPKAVQQLFIDEMKDWPAALPYRFIPIDVPHVSSNFYYIQTVNTENVQYLGTHIFGIDSAGPDYAPLLLANHILGGGPGSVLWRDIRVAKGYSYHIESELSPSHRDQRCGWNLNASFAIEDYPEVLDLIKQSIDRCAQPHEITQEQLNSARQDLLKQFSLHRANDSILNLIMMRNLKNHHCFDWQAQLEENLQRCSLADVQRCFKRYLQSAFLSEAVASDFQQHCHLKT
ncbi:M16 family metallopeptidase [Brackiella oedipodis]|uniref:M16 family metallopeptidase n=1 Tax=Brackiella oedipodis TaxID=124225 RepID=UPI00048ED6FD|nr:pitrilysin family protein [Brackiella oedipodis]